MKIYLGLDAGSSATKAAVIDEHDRIILTERISRLEGRDLDSVTVNRDVRKLLGDCALADPHLGAVMTTGAGSTFLEGDICGAKTGRLEEFETLGAGGLFASGLEKAVVCSIGTGTSIVAAGPDGARHVGGSAIGGGTLIGLCKKLFGITDFKTLDTMCEKGDLHKVDKFIRDIAKIDYRTLPDIATASNLGKMEDDASDEDIVRGIFNLIYQTAGTFAVFACRNEHVEDAVITGALASTSFAHYMLKEVGKLYGIRMIIPEKPAYITAIGAALKARELEEY